ncbi:phage baseplate assembly V family protein [Burkholderia sp. MSHR3999]|uniref:phage baseplate assembly protein V n=1 Tax=Burkholderia sp. MSHR3999 TaxID=1542965 RepID=UPI0005AC9662|nr:phage baseplate assembly protein V [Burkholderia sp. MSHR3999]KIP18303.1 phage baseplate assembly V family protein [Burkholderia sp. MSHR3999]
MWDKVDGRIKIAMSKIRLAFRAVISIVGSDSGVQLIQGQGVAGETLQDNELFQHYGFTSNPPAGTMAIVIPVGGKTAHGVIVATEHASARRKSLASGEVAIYTSEGDSIVLRHGRIIDINTQTLNINADNVVNIKTRQLNVDASEEVNANTPAVNASQQVTVAGALAANGGMTAKAGEGGGAAVAIDGEAHITEDVVAGGKSLVHHEHQDSNGGVTTPPL